MRRQLEPLWSPLEARLVRAVGDHIWLQARCAPGRLPAMTHTNLGTYTLVVLDNLYMDVAPTQEYT